MLQTETRRAAARRGFADAVPLVASYLPFGLILGATIAAADIGPWAGWASSPIVFAGAAQLALVDLVDAGAAAVVVVATALVINLRHVMYSGALAPYFRRDPAGWRVFAPFLLVDPVFTLATIRFAEIDRPALRRAYYGALGGTLWLGWTTMTAGGLVVGAALPASWNLGLAVPLTFVALLMPTITDRPTAAAAAVGGVVAVVARDVPFHLGLIVAALAGVAVGLALDDGTVEAAEPAGSPHA